VTETGTYTPTFSQAQVLNAMQQAEKSGGALNGNLLRDYNYYMYGDPEYSTASNAASSAATYSAPAAQVSYNNGGLGREEVEAIQRAYGLDDDGYWGPNSQKMTGYASAAEAAQHMPSGRTMDQGTFSREMQTIMSYLSQGMDAKAEDRINRIWSQLSAEQRAQAEAALAKNGVAMG